MKSAPETPEQTRPGARRIILNLVGFAVGIGLFAWIVHRAFFGHGDDVDPETLRAQWTQLVERPSLIAALLGCTAASALLNGSTFWVTSGPLKQLRWRDMQLLNLVANMLNYAPLRLGALARVLYHMRVDGLTLIQVGAWFAFIGVIVILGIGACAAATLLYGELDVIWMAIALGIMFGGGLTLRLMADHPLIARVTRGLNRLVTDARSLWGAIVIRVLDLAAYAARMAVAAAILELEIPGAQVILLSVIALAASLVPFGRFGFREACVALAAAQLDLGVDDIDSITARLALVESMGEALFFIPLGAIAAWWYRGRVLRR